MERASKPVMWTDEEAMKRLIGWLRDKGWKIGKPNFLTRLSFIKKGDLFFNLLNYEVSAEYIARLDKAVSIITKHKLITHDSLLHDLNIIKQIGRLEYTSKWIDKILAGQKTMDVLPTQHACGYYELWDADRQEVRGIVEVTKAERWETDFWLNEILKNDVELASTPRFTEISGDTEGFSYNKRSIYTGSCEHSYEYCEIIELYPCWIMSSGFNSAESFIEYHRTHFQSVKYAITYRVVDMKGDGND